MLRTGSSRRQAGFSSVMVIAMVVLLAAMTTYALRFVSGSLGSQSLDTQVLRADQAAKAGIEWQRYRLRTLGLGGCANSTNITVPFQSSAFNVTVTCQRTPATLFTVGGINTYNNFTFTATACSPTAGACPVTVQPLGPNYVQRQYSANALCPSAGGTVANPCKW